jgi:hypothetical protein
MNIDQGAFDHCEQACQNLAVQAELCRKIATLTSDSDLAAEWNDCAAEMDALLQASGRIMAGTPIQQMP